MYPQVSKVPFHFYYYYYYFLLGDKTKIYNFLIKCCVLDFLLEYHSDKVKFFNFDFC